MFDPLNQQIAITLLSKSVLEGVYFHGQHIQNIISEPVQGMISLMKGGSGTSDSEETDLRAKSREDRVVFMNSKQKVLRVFQMLHPDKAPEGKRPLTEDEFRYLRRAVGNGNYDKAFALLGVYWRNGNAERQKIIAKAAAVLGEIKGAKKYYDEFAQNL